MRQFSLMKLDTYKDYLLNGTTDEKKRALNWIQNIDPKFS